MKQFCLHRGWQAPRLSFWQPQKVNNIFVVNYPQDFSCVSLESTLWLLLMWIYVYVFIEFKYINIIFGVVKYKANK